MLESADHTEQRKHFDWKAEQGFWEVRGPAPSPPSAGELDLLEADVRLWVPQFPQLFQDRRILDLGAGRALLGTLISQRYRPALVASVDIGFHRLRSAVASMRQSSRLDLVCADAFRLPFADESFDYVLANSVLHHLPDLGQAISEVARVLCRGGSYIGREPNFDNPLIRTYVFTFDGTWVRRGVSVTQNEYPLKAKEIKSCFGEAGFQCDLHYFWRRLRIIHHPVFSCAISVRAQRLR